MGVVGSNQNPDISAASAAQRDTFTPNNKEDHDDHSPTWPSGEGYLISFLSSHLQRRRIVIFHCQCDEMANVIAPPSYEDVEKTGHRDVVHDEFAKHGDRALAMIGDARVTLTDEEVS